LESSDPQTAQTRARAISLYVHVPFCTDKCLYCDFFSVPRHSIGPDIQKAVIHQTIMQAHYFLKARAQGEAVETIFMGGGTPSALSPENLAPLLEACRDKAAVEWTVEANPESLDEKFLDLCEGAGVTRLSVGVQTLRDSLLRLLKRPASRSRTLAALELLAGRWHGELNLDYIAGIPGQSTEEVREDLALLAQFVPSHISLYQLTFEPETELVSRVRQGGIVPNTCEQDEDLWFAGKEALESRGYQHYEISNFCLPGRECRHNLRYWRMEPYAGVGPSAVSTVPAKDFAVLLGRPDLAETPGGILRVANTRDFHAFLGGEDSLWGLEVESVKPEDFLLENLMMGLRLREGIRVASWQRRFNRGFDELFPGLWKKWCAEGYADEPPGSLRLTESGRMLLDGLLGELADRIAEGILPQFAVSWP
jgi:oxygen-independent coproporphyrinogen-3 oxidase